MEELVRKTGQAAGGGEGEVGGHVEVGEVFDRDFAGDGKVVAGRTGVLQNGLDVAAGERRWRGRGAC
jgi:hypothetical protein